MPEGEELVFDEFFNLIFDGEHVQSVTAEDKTYLENFKEMRQLSFNACRMNSLDNFPVYD